MAGIVDETREDASRDEKEFSEGADPAPHRVEGVTNSGEHIFVG